MKPPFVPSLSGLDDTSNFDEFEKIQSTQRIKDFKQQRDFSGKDLPFVGFTYTGKSSKDIRLVKILMISFSYLNGKNNCGRNVFLLTGHIFSSTYLN